MKRKVLIVDDSPTARLVLRRIFNADDSGLEVVGEAATGDDALHLARRLAPDVITMDVQLGHDDGVEVTAAIMQRTPTPIVLVTGATPTCPTLAFRAMQAGALDVLAKPSAVGNDELGTEAHRIMRVVRALSRVPVITRRSALASSTPPRPTLRVASPVRRAPERADTPAFVAIGASTGGPPMLIQLLSAMPRPYPSAVLIVQHIEEGFGRGLAEWLATSTSQPVVYCDREQLVEPGTVYLAPDDAHLRWVSPGVAAPTAGPPRRYHRPSVDELFESLVPVAHRTLALLLTGMGSDGADGMCALRRAGARTLAQAPSSCVVDGMPQSAIELGGAVEVLSPTGLSAALRAVARTTGFEA